ncbi:MAG: hypothetical protein J6Y75_07210 [Spirochaetaceae bacterium]|nr:hypothetical protein [Spirochaetaceae bacterium]
MKSIVIYNSQTGFTKKYAEWIAEAAACECVEFKQAAKLNLADYDAIVFGSWCMAGNIVKLAWFKKQMPALAAAGKKLIVYAVGGSPEENPDVAVAMRRVFTDEDRETVKVFYCPGGFNYEKMNSASKLMMKMFTKVLASKKDATEDEKKMAEMISHSYDISDKKYADAIAAELK